VIVSAHQPQYMPWLGYFDKIARSDLFVILDDVQYKEREFQNRNKLRTDRGWMWLTVPVISSGQGRQKIREVRIDQSAAWRAAHWKSLRAWYGSAPYFSKHADFFCRTYEKDWKFLCDLNVHIVRYCLDVLNIKTPCQWESEIGTTMQKTDRIIQICHKVGADAYLSGNGGRKYLEEEKFALHGIRLAYQDFNHPVYPQRFVPEAAAFIASLSAIDYIFNESRNILSCIELSSCINKLIEAGEVVRSGVREGA
jgi:hypothetical protein